MWNSFKIAFAMYSKIPMPHTKWDKENMKYSMCFFPLVGGVIGVIVYLWSLLSSFLSVNDILRTAIYVVLPIIITGGIHVDGFVDTMDAVNSYQSKERKLEILKDSHIGAFALITCLTYFILSFGLWSEVNGDGVLIIALGFVLSRALSGFSIVTFPLAKDTGLAAIFSDSAEKERVRVTMISYIIVISILMLVIDIKMGIVAIVLSALSFLYYKVMSIKNFGGITGDLAGFFLQICELSIVFAVVIVESISRVI